MAGQTYTTKEIAAAAGVHVNTVRFYEEIGFLTKPERLKNGYRVYTGLHLAQCLLIRRAMRTEVLQNGLRKKAVELVRLCAALDFDGALAATDEYRAMIDAEMRRAKEAARAAGRSLESDLAPQGAGLCRREAAKAQNVTPETLRTWERSGLLSVPRGENGYRVYGEAQLERINLIRTLRCAGYSLFAILRLLSAKGRRTSRPAEALLDTPADGEDVVSACDRLLFSLQSTAKDAEALAEMLSDLKKNFFTLQ